LTKKIAAGSFELVSPFIIRKFVILQLFVYDFDEDTDAKFADRHIFLHLSVFFNNFGFYLFIFVVSLLASFDIVSALQHFTLTHCV